MPVCFQLIPKGEKEPRNLPLVDDMMREHFKVAPDAEHWFRNWSDSIGFRVACGKTLPQVREQFEDYVRESAADQAGFYEELIEIVDYLQEIYDTDSFYCPK